MKLRPLVKGAEKQVRIARVHALAGLRRFGWCRTRLNLPRNETFDLRSSQNDGVRVRLVDPEESFERAPPHLPDEPHMPFQFASNQHGTCPATFVAEFNRGRFWGFYGGSVFTEGGQLVAELSKDVWGPTLHTAYTRAHLPTPKWLAGRALSLVTPEAANNYHHWTVDLLSRAGLAERAGYRLHDFDHVLIKDRGLPFQKEALKRLEIDEDKLIRVNDHTHLQVQTLVVPSVRMDNTRVNRGDLQFVRRLFLPQEPSPQSARRRLYVSRRDASFRRVVNEPEIMPLLQQHGFEEVSMSKMSVVEQAQLFAEAEVLVGPNGSALANVIFANPACRVIEFFAPGWVVPYNWMLCASLKLHYTAMIGDGPRPAAGTLPREIKQDIHLNVAAFKRILEKLPSRK